MASTNQSPKYKEAELKFLNAKTNGEKLVFLEEMIRECPKHKSSEKMLANLKTRYIKLKEKIEAVKKVSRGSSKQGIKKEDIQIVIVGKTRSGKSELLKALTNATPKISESEFEKFTTKKPIIGIMNYSGISIQIIENPSIESEYYDKGLSNSADILLILFNNFSDLDFIDKNTSKINGKKLYVFNSFSESENNLRKVEARLQSMKYNFVVINPKTGFGFGELKSKILQNSGKIRVFTKQPGKEKSEKPVILNENSSVKDVAEKILHGFSEKIKETKIWGPSSKFAGQKVGLTHVLKDLDLVEFKMR
ncbi:TGS domain-containing protein [Candidatus Pacearchaeota archaeon]|nr:TGS domain-containing protein [Candidatus Pacearchaeota archaeon]